MIWENRRSLLVLAVTIGALAGMVGLPGTAAPPVVERAEAAGEVPAPTVAEARARARLLHEAIHGALQVMHRDFFDADELHSLPSESLEDVFRELGRSFGVQVSWLAVNAKVMNVDHKPQDEFEEKAVEAIEAGKAEFDLVIAGNYRHAGMIRLGNSCLKCHVPNRTSLEDRAAALVISMPVRTEKK